MSSISKRSNGQWRARYRDEANKEHTRHFSRKLDAQTWLENVTAAMVNDTYVDPRAGAITVADYAKQWEVSQIGSANTLRITDIALRRHIVPALGKQELRAVRRSHVQSLIKSLAAKTAPNSVRSIYDILRRLFDAAAFDRLITRSPCERITLPAVPDQEVEPATPAQVSAIASAIDPRFRGPVVALAGTGLRIGELLGLRVADVDFLRRTVRVQRQRLQSGAITPPKTSRSARTIPVGQVVIDELAAHLAAYPTDEYLVTNSDGSPTWYRQWRPAWQAGMAASGIGRDVTTHDLRHFYASALIAGGASVKQVQTALGHSSPATTLRVYSHLWPGDEDRTRAIVDTALSDLSGQLDVPSKEIGT